MHSGHGFQSRLLVYLCLALAALSIGLLAGCGEGDETLTVSQRAEEEEPLEEFRPTEIRARKYVERRYGDEEFYPYIRGIHIGIGTKGGTSVTTTLYNHKNWRRNKRMAEEICQAVLSAPQVQRAGVFYDSANGGSTASCP